MALTTSSLPNGVVGSAYSQTVTATGGDGSYTWAVSVGLLPAGLALAASTGVISGSPTTAATSNFTVQVKSGDGQTATKDLSITVNAGGEVLADGTLVVTTYGHWVEGEEPFVVSVRFTLEELDGKLAG